MPLTRPTVAQLNTVVTEISDPITLLNKGSTQANVDVGFVLNRDGGLSPNVAIYWNETADSLVAAYTTSTGGVYANIALTSYANLTTGNVTANGNITTVGGYFIGNGYFLTGMVAGGAGSYGNVNVKAYTESMGFANYSNVNVAAYVTTNGLTNYSNVNVKAYTESMGFQNFGNVNVAAYVTTNGLTNYSNVNVAAYTQTQSYTNYSNVNLAAYLGGAVTIGGNLTVQGNLFVNGNVTVFNTNNLSINDSMIYLADDNLADTLDIGIVSAFTDAVRYQHTGFVRDATDGVWKLFANVVPEPTTTVDFTNANYANLLVGNLVLSGPVPSTSTTTGALTVAGGVGIAGSLYAAPNGAAVFGSGIQVGTANVYISGGQSTLTVTSQAYRILAEAHLPRWGIGTAANGYSFFNIWPVNNRNYLESGSRPLSVGFAGGAGGNVLYMDPVTGTTVLTPTTASTDTTTGALVVAGGVGVGGNLSVGGNLTVYNDDGNIYIGDIKTGLFPTNNDSGILFDGRLSSFKSGIFTELDGTILSYAINATQLGTINQFTAGGVFRLDTRDAQRKFVVIRRPTNSFSEEEAFDISLDTGLARFTSNLQVGRTATTSSNLTVAHSTPSTSTTTGALQVVGGVGIRGNLNVGGNITVSGNISAENINFTGNIIHADSGDPVGYIRYLDDIAMNFDGSTKKFLITYDEGTVYDVNNPLQLQVYVGGIIVPPARYIRDYHNLPEVAVFDHGFYLQKGLDDANAVVISTVATSTGNLQVSSGGNTIVFATAPSSSMDFQAFVRTNSDPQPAFKFKQTPFTALNIMLGP